MSSPALPQDSLRILIVEDNPGDAFLVEHMLAEMPQIDAQTWVATTLAEAQNLLEQQAFTIIFTDLDLPDSSGLETVGRLLHNHQGIPVVILSGIGARGTAIDAIRMGAQDFLEKDLISEAALDRMLAHSLERHSLNQALQHSMRDLDSANLRFVNLIGDLTDAVVVVDLGGEMKFVNPAAEKMFGKDAKFLIGEQFGLPVDNLAPVEVDLVNRNGEARIAEIRVVETAWDGEPARLASLRDITERKRSERSMQVAQQAAETANDMKSRFLANMSHELRTPLNSIIGYSEIIHEEVLGEVGNERYRDYAGDIHRSGHHLLSLINDLLDLSKAEAGHYEIVDSEFDLTTLVHDAIRLIGSQAEAKGQMLEVEAMCGDCHIVGGERQITQVLVNLLSNAVKFTPEAGSIVVRVRPGNLGSVAIEVEDTGIGIEPDEIPRLFDAYSQVGEPYLKDQAQGTGLGLALSKRLMELHGGFLRIRSSPDEGTTATMVLPRSRVRWPQAAPAQTVNA